MVLIIQVWKNGKSNDIEKNRRNNPTPGYDVSQLSFIV